MQIDSSLYWGSKIELILMKKSPFSPLYPKECRKLSGFGKGRIGEIFLRSNKTGG